MPRKLDNEQVNEIRFERLEGYSQADTAEIYNVSKKTIYNIQHGKLYADVPLPKVARYPGYTIYPNGKIVSDKTNSVLSGRNGSVRLLSRDGTRETVSVKTLERIALGV